MMTIFQKLRTITLGAAHALLDKAIDEMSIPALKQNLRDIEAAIKTLDEEAAEAEGSMVTANNRATAITAQVDELNTNIVFILSDGDDSNDHLSEPLQARLTGLEVQQKSALAEVETFKQTMMAVDQVASALKAKQQTRLTQITLLQSQANTAEAKNKAADAIELANKLGGGEISSVDDFQERIETKSNIADARLRRAMGDMQTGLGQDAILADAKAKIAARKAKIAADKAKQ
ncbi:MAG: hypothetical protein WC819_04295 [Parcubacteria group bacterium]|jgi:hypothetical protein